MLKLCMQNYKVYGVIEIDHGSYTVNGTTCVEAQINGVVPRVFLSTIEFNDYFANKTKYMSGPTKGRKRKCLPDELLGKFNGETPTPVKRQRKPNSKFSDFVTSPNYIQAEEQDKNSANLNEMRSFDEIKRTSNGKIHKSRVKEHILKQSEDDLELDTSGRDPLDTQNTDDEIVHSFLPTFEPSEVINYKDEDTPNMPDSKLLKSNENEETLIPSAEAKDASESPQSNMKPISVPLVLDANSENSMMNDDVSDDQHFTNSNWVPAHPKTPADSPQLIKRNLPLKSYTSPKKTYATKTRGKSHDARSPKTLSDSRFILIDSDVKYKLQKVSDIDFNKLVRSLKSVKLPAKNWKIRIIVSPQETITEVIFTNKETVERCVKFARTVGVGYKIMFGKSEVKLLGAPTLQTFEDVAILLEIINSIPANSHVLEYC